VPQSLEDALSARCQRARRREGASAEANPGPSAARKLLGSSARPAHLGLAFLLAGCSPCSFVRFRISPRKPVIPIPLVQRLRSQVRSAPPYTTRLLRPPDQFQGRSLAGQRRTRWRCDRRGLAKAAVYHTRGIQPARISRPSGGGVQGLGMARRQQRPGGSATASRAHGFFLSERSCSTNPPPVRALTQAVFNRRKESLYIVRGFMPWCSDLSLSAGRYRHWLKRERPEDNFAGLCFGDSHHRKLCVG